jgi:GAF domain-containing protein
MKASLPANEQARLCALRAYGVLDTAPEPAFDDLVSLAAQICGTPLSFISLLDESRQWFKAKLGLEVCETSRADSFCSHAILQPDYVLVVPDASKDPRFSNNPLVTGSPWIRFYAGAPLVTPAGHAIGTLSVVDYKPHELNQPQQRALVMLARQTVDQFELRLRVTESARI